MRRNESIISMLPTATNADAPTSDKIMGENRFDRKDLGTRMVVNLTDGRLECEDERGQG